ncbi:hypothetical protein [Clostridium botulinum]
MNITNVLKDHGVGIGKYGIGKTIQDYNLEEVYYKGFVSSFNQYDAVNGTAITMDKENTIWFSAGESIIRIDSEGNQISKISYDGISNIIAYDNSIFVKRHYGKVARFSLAGEKIWEKSYEGYMDGFYFDETFQYLYTSYVDDYKTRHIIRISLGGSDSEYASMRGSSTGDYNVTIRPNAIYYKSSKSIYKCSLPSISEMWNYDTGTYDGFIAIDKSDNVYSTFKSSLYKFDKSGNVLWSSPLPDIKAYFANFIFLDYKNFIYTMNSNYIGKYTSNGLLTKTIHSEDSFGALTSNNKDYIYVAAGYNINKYNFAYKAIS